jgi:hypothetical protein
MLYHGLLCVESVPSASDCLRRDLIASASALGRESTTSRWESDLGVASDRAVRWVKTVLAASPSTQVEHDRILWVSRKSPLKGRRDPPAQKPCLHVRASGWYEDTGFYEEAVTHTLAASGCERTDALIERHRTRISRRGDTVIVERCFRALSEDVIRSRPILCVARGWMVKP